MIKKYLIGSNGILITEKHVIASAHVEHIHVQVVSENSIHLLSIAGVVAAFILAIGGREKGA